MYMIKHIMPLGAEREMAGQELVAGRFILLFL